MAPTRYENSAGADAKPLEAPLKFHFSGRTAKNRLMKAAMAETMGTWNAADREACGIPTKELIELYKHWGGHENGFGMILTGNMQVTLETPNIPGDLLLDLSLPMEGPRFEAFKKLAAAGKANGSLMVAQISHPGRQLPITQARNGEVIAPSAVQLGPAMGMTFAKPREATKAEIDYVIRSFAHAAAYLEAAGFDGVELHGAHGYLLAQFLSARTNRRTDEYGGSLENRMRLLVEVTRAVRERTSPSFVVGAKLNSVEFQDDGLTPEQAGEVCRALQDGGGGGTAGLDFVELSGGNYEKSALEWTKETTLKREAFFLRFADLIVPQLARTAAERRTKVYLTGGLRTVDGMVRALEVVDGVGVGRPAAQEPRLAQDLLEGRLTAGLQPVPTFENSTMGLVLAGAQMRQISRGQEPFDASEPPLAASFLKDVEAHMAARAGDGGAELPFYTDFSGEAQPLRSQ